jgi:hypothetical protein
MCVIHAMRSDITSVDVKANGTNEFLFLFAGCGFMRNMRSVGLGLLRCLGGVTHTPLTFSTNVPPMGEDAFDLFIVLRMMRHLKRFITFASWRNLWV